jgi:hypothetical protein
MSPGSSSHSWLSLRLQQEDIVGIDVRPDAATVARERKHRVVDPRIGNEAKALEELVRRIIVKIDPLNEQRPAGRGERRQGPARNRPAAHRPAIGFIDDEPRFDVVACGEREKSASVEAGQRAGDRAANQEGLLLPMRSHELGSRQTPEQR